MASSSNQAPPAHSPVGPNAASNQVPPAHSPVGPTRSSSPHSRGKDQARLHALMKLRDILCPACQTSQKVGSMKLRTATGFSKIKCKNKICNESRPSAQWRCRCQKLWIKCPLHLHLKATAISRKKREATVKEKLLARYGVDRPLPMMREKANKNPTGSKRKLDTAQLDEASSRRQVPIIGQEHCERVHTIRPGTKFASMFPHLVKPDSPT